MSDPHPHAMTTQTLRRSREPVLALCRVLVKGPITALAATSPRRKVKRFGRRESGPCGGRKEVPQGRNGSINPLCVASTGNHNQPFTLYMLIIACFCKKVPQDKSASTKSMLTYTSALPSIQIQRCGGAPLRPPDRTCGGGGGDARQSSSR